MSTYQNQTADYDPHSYDLRDLNRNQCADACAPMESAATPEHRLASAIGGWVHEWRGRAARGRPTPRVARMSNDSIPMVPSVGRIVHYTLTESDAAQINKRRRDANSSPAIAANAGTVIHVGNPVDAGDVFPMLITRVWGPTPASSVQGQVFLDGNDQLWVTSVEQGDGPRQWHRPPQV